MKIFLDTANVEQIKTALNIGILDGVTTNPTLASKENKTFEENIKEILSLVNVPVSVETVSQTAEGMVEDGRKFSGWGWNAVIKVPMTPEGLKACRILTKEGMKVNLTLCFSPNQVLLAAKSNATYASIFVGRLEDAGHPVEPIIRDSLQILKNYNFKTELIVASVRHSQHILDSAKLGAPIVTIPFDVYEKIFKHPLTDIGIKKFLEDWEKTRE